MKFLTDFSMLPKFFGMYSISRFNGVVASMNYAKEAFGKELPVLEYIGSVKLHGTNGMLSYIKELDGVAIGSKERFLSVDSDNMGFAKFILDRESTVSKLFSLIKEECAEDFAAANHVHIYGEWCGQGIQKKVALSNIPKQFVIFGGRFVFEEPSGASEGRFKMFSPELVAKLTNAENAVRNIFEFETYKITIDFNKVDSVLDELDQLTIHVEDCCPVGKAHGVEGVGEGIVWQCVSPEYRHPRYWFKAKGAKHAVSKQKSSVEIDPEVLSTVVEFVEATCTQNRVEQAMSVLQGTLGREVTKKDTGKVIEWVVADIAKEESERMPESMDMRIYGKQVSKAVFLHMDVILSLADFD